MEPLGFFVLLIFLMTIGRYETILGNTIKKWIKQKKDVSKSKEDGDSEITGGVHRTDENQR